MKLLKRIEPDIYVLYGEGTQPAPCGSVWQAATAPQTVRIRAKPVTTKARAAALSIVIPACQASAIAVVSTMPRHVAAA